MAEHKKHQLTMVEDRKHRLTAVEHRKYRLYTIEQVERWLLMVENIEDVDQPLSVRGACDLQQQEFIKYISFQSKYAPSLVFG